MAIEKREQVFVSSTYLDLRTERQAVIQTLLEADCFPSGMELFPASDDAKWTLIKRVIDDCDYYVVVVGGRYGSVDADTGLSFTEMEFDYACETGKPVMGFLHGDPGKIPADKTDLDSILRDSLDAFREKISQRMVKYWTTPAELAGQVALSLIQTRKTHPANGWVRAENVVTPELEREIAQLRAVVAEQRAELEARRPTDVIATEDLAQGKDRHSLDIRLSYIPNEGRMKSVTLHTDISWDEIFAKVGPILMDEATETQIQESLDGLKVPLLVEADDFPDDFKSLASATFVDGVFDDVKVQLYSLGLIERSERRRAVSDSNKYWKLTTRGHDHLLSLRAIRRPVTTDD